MAVKISAMVKWLSSVVGVVALALATPVWADRVVAITDGDTVEALIDGKAQKVRLAQIDAPEKQQHFGSVAKNHLSQLAFGKDCDIKHVDQDRYGRIVGQLYCDGIDVNLQMVTDGMAWAYNKYVTDKAYPAAQEEAMTSRRGLWQDPSPTAPWDWRKLKKKQ